VTSIDSPRRPIVRRALVGLAAAALALSACGSGEDSASADGTSDENESSAASPDDSSASNDGSSDGDAAQGLQQNGPITVEGDPLGPFDSSLEDLAVGKAAPVISGESFDRTPITIGGPTAAGFAATSGNATLVVFLAHWCPHCNDEIPELLALDEAGDLPEGLDVIGVSTAVDAAAENYPPSEWAVEKGWKWQMMADDEALSAIKAYGGTSFPFSVVLDAEGNVLARRAGSGTAAEIKAFLDAALGG
jgi:cytochrome c biogenesis protein CcmG/thiol:disulfide interchange protein DsbE